MYEYKVQIRRIVDGDTVDVDIDLVFDTILSKQRIRLYGIDTPESRTRDKEEKFYGKVSAKFLKEQCKNSSEIFLKTYFAGTIYDQCFYMFCHGGAIFSIL